MDCIARAFPVVVALVLAGCDGIQEVVQDDASGRIYVVNRITGSARYISDGVYVPVSDVENSSRVGAVVQLAERPSEVDTLFADARSYAANGEADNALQALERAADGGFVGLLELEDASEFDPQLRLSPEFQRLLGRIRDNASSCRSTGYDRFDFLVGHWNVSYEGESPFAEFEIKESMDNCTIRGFGRYADGDTRTFFGFYDPGAGSWRQAWISAGFIIDVQGARDSENRQLVGTLHMKSVRREPMSVRLTHELQADGTIREYLPVSVDGGTSWTEGRPAIWRRKRPVD